VAERPAQLAALLRQVEEGSAQVNSSYRRNSRVRPHSRAFSLPASVRGEDLRGALTLLSVASPGVESEGSRTSALAGIARLVAASPLGDIWSRAQTGGVYALSFEPWSARVIPAEPLAPSMKIGAANC